MKSQTVGVQESPKPFRVVVGPWAAWRCQSLDRVRQLRLVLRPGWLYVIVGSVLLTVVQLFGLNAVYGSRGSRSNRRPLEPKVASFEDAGPRQRIFIVGGTLIGGTMILAPLYACRLQLERRDGRRTLSVRRSFCGLELRKWAVELHSEEPLRTVAEAAKSSSDSARLMCDSQVLGRLVFWSLSEELADPKRRLREFVSISPRV